MNNPDHLLVVYTECEPGKEEEFNRWYDEIHVPDLLKVDGITGVQRFEHVAIEGTTPANRWLAIYEVNGDLDAMRSDLLARRPERELSAHYLPGLTVKHFFTAVGDHVSRPVAATSTDGPDGPKNGEQN